MASSAMGRDGDNRLDAQQIAVDGTIGQRDRLVLVTQHQKCGRQRDGVDDGFIGDALLTCTSMCGMNGIEPLARRRVTDFYGRVTLRCP